MGEVLLESEQLLSSQETEEDSDDCEQAAGDDVMTVMGNQEPSSKIEQPEEGHSDVPSESSTTDSIPVSSPLSKRPRDSVHLSICAAVCTRIRQSWFVTESCALLKLALPIILTLFFQQFLMLANVLFVGHFSDKLTFDAVALANSFVNVTGLSIMIGLSSAADTLCPQSYGFKNYKRVGVIVQRGIIILVLACLPISVIWFNSESILLLLQQQPCVARVSGQYIRVFVLVLPGMVISTMLQKYLQAQSVVWVFVASGMVVTIIGVIVCAALVVGAKLGAIGAALAVVVANTLQPVLLIGYIWFRGLHKKTWGGWSWQSLDEWGQFLKLGVAGSLMICFEWWTYEISVLVTGSIDNTQLAVNTILIQLFTFAFMIPLGIGIATSVRVGNELGAGRPLKAKRSSYTAVAMDAVIAISLVILLLATKDYVGKVFISDIDVIRETSIALYPGACLLFMDHVQGTISGVLRGVGLQPLAAVVNFTVFYLIGLPTGICLALLADMGTTGMWIGLAIAATLQGTIFTIILLTMNWKKQSERAKKNASDSNKTEMDGEIESEEDNEQQVEVNTDDNELGQHLVAVTFNKSSDKGVDDGECDDVVDGEMDIEEVPLVSYQDVEEQTTTTETESSSRRHNSVKRKRLRLLLTKGSVFTIGILVLIIGAILAGIFPHGGTLESDCIVNNTCYCNAIDLETTSLTFNSTPSTSMDYSVTRTQTAAVMVNPTMSVTL